MDLYSAYRFKKPLMRCIIVGLFIVNSRLITLVCHRLRRIKSLIIRTIVFYHDITIITPTHKMSANHIIKFQAVDTIVLLFIIQSQKIVSKSPTTAQKHIAGLIDRDAYHFSTASNPGHCPLPPRSLPPGRRPAPWSSAHPIEDNPRSIAPLC